MDSALDLMWEKYRSWAMCASTLRAELDRWRFITLLLTVAGAVLATLASQLPGWMANTGSIARILSAISAVSMALASWSANTMIDPTREKNWIRARALAERAKSEGYRYATRTTPYDDDKPEQKLLDKLNELTAEGEDVPALSIQDVKPGLDQPSHPLLVQEYIAIRVEKQLTSFFEPKSAINERSALRCTRLVQLLSGCAAILAALGAYFPGISVGAWVATLSTVSAAVGAHALAKRYQRLAATYRLVADRLQMRLAAWRSAMQSSQDITLDKAFINDVENILLGENQAWAADYISRPVTLKKAAHR
ncbi:DUF4231 domain-containing protein [Paraburkholderia nodosa]|uniref:DUF4231 domain-containing protein n=1 Tax=Paraburkholderia nodosa TaxID=392320 RepID=UPI000553AA48|nr:DUF4231 domain-containing protein [Paraburkholderia nodosa]